MDKTSTFCQKTFKAFKDPISFYFRALRKSFCFKGRACREEFLAWFSMFMIVFSFPLLLLPTCDTNIELRLGSVFMLPFLLYLFIPTISLIFRRLQDLGISGWAIVVWIYPLTTFFFVSVEFFIFGREPPLLLNSTILNLFWLLSFLCLFIKKGTEGENEYGSSPEIEIISDKKLIALKIIAYIFYALVSNFVAFLSFLFYALLVYKM